MKTHLYIFFLTLCFANLHGMQDNVQLHQNNIPLKDAISRSMFDHKNNHYQEYKYIITHPTPLLSKYSEPIKFEDQIANTVQYIQRVENNKTITINFDLYQQTDKYESLPITITNNDSKDTYNMAIYNINDSHSFIEHAKKCKNTYYKQAPLVLNISNTIDEDAFKEALETCNFKYINTFGRQDKPFSSSESSSFSKTKIFFLLGIAALLCYEGYRYKSYLTEWNMGYGGCHFESFCIGLAKAIVNFVRNDLSRHNIIN